MGKSRLRKPAPTSVNGTVGRRSREYLTEREVERLIEAAKQNRSGHRDATAILVAYRHGLRASEVVVLRWDDIDLATGRLHVRRAKGGDASVHPISARESRALPCFIIRDAKRAGARLRPFRGGAGTAPTALFGLFAQDDAGMRVHVMYLMTYRTSHRLIDVVVFRGIFGNKALNAVSAVWAPVHKERHAGIAQRRGARRSRP